MMAATIAVTGASIFFRASLGSGAPELSKDLGLTAGGLGVANAAFFIALTLMQIPVGILLDRWGPRRVVTVFSTFTIAGVLIDAAATSQVFFIAGRLLTGVGCSASFMASIVLCGRWFAGPRFATMLSRVFALSGFGYLLAGSPWAAIIGEMGWRVAFNLSAGFSFLTTAYFYLFVRDSPDGLISAERGSIRQSLSGFGRVARTPGLGPIVALHFVTYASFLTVFGVWAGPYLNDIYDLGPIPRGNVLFGMGVAQMGATLCYGPLDRYLSRRGIVIVGTLASAVILLPLALFAKPPLAIAISALVLFCGINSFSVINVADANSRFSPAIAGRGATAVNLFQVVGTSAIPIATSLFVKSLGGETNGRLGSDYRAVFGMIIMCLVIPLFCYVLFYKKAAPL